MPASSSPDNRYHSMVDDVLSRMSIEQKIGQCLTLLWRGPFVTRSVVEQITKLHVGGLRIEPVFMESAFRTYYDHDPRESGYKKPKGYFSIAETYFRPHDRPITIGAEDYAAKLNRLKTIAMERPLGIPLHVSTDFEGDFSHDWPFDGIHIFPSNMGLCATGSPKLVYESGRAIARQLAALGINMLHSPVCDVNTNPNNPEIGVRAFSDDPKTCSRYALKFWQGLEDGGLVATAKHFPGRGNSDVDAHYALPVSESDADHMRNVELAPFRKLVKAGLKAAMTAHSAYPALDPSGLPATLSPTILQDVLRHELGFEGVITTDAMGMGAIARKYGVPTGCAMAIKAGCDLVLLKFEGELRTQVYFELKRWVDKGWLTEDELDTRVRRVLLMKAREGLFETGGLVNAADAGSAIRDPETAAVCRRAARRGALVMRDRQNLLPLKPAQTVMVVEQTDNPVKTPGTRQFHDYLLNEDVLEKSLNVINVTTRFKATQDEVERVLALSAKADVVMVSNYYVRSLSENNSDLIRALIRKRRKVVVVTNTPYAFGAPPKAGTVVCSFGSNPSSIRAAVDLMYGKYKPSAQLPIKPPKGEKR